jgi:uncharacterized protein (UPF0332 family)
MTNEQRALMRKARASLEAARALQGLGFFDFTASRAYYTMFYMAEAMLLQEGLSFSKHSAVIAAFGRQFAQTDVALAAYHRYLIDGQVSRNIGDYDIGPGISEDDARQQIDRAQNFVDLAKSKLGSLPEDSGKNG